MNTTLRNTDSHLSDDKLHIQMEILLDVDLQRFVNEADIAGLTTLRDWILAVKELDDVSGSSTTASSSRRANKYVGRSFGSHMTN